MKLRGRFLRTKNKKLVAITATLVTFAICLTLAYIITNRNDEHHSGSAIECAEATCFQKSLIDCTPAYIEFKNASYEVISGNQQNCKVKYVDRYDNNLHMLCIISDTPSYNTGLDTEFILLIEGVLFNKSDTNDEGISCSGPLLDNMSSL